MKKKEVVERWADPAFLLSLNPSIDRIFAEGAPIRDVRLEGIDISYGSLEELRHLGFDQRIIMNSDFSYSNFECSFYNSKVESTSFHCCSFNGTNFKRSHVAKCVFTESVVKGGVCNDSVFEDCDFTGARLSDKSKLTLEFLRSRFVRCTFMDCFLDGVELRAAAFHDCIFTGAKFTNSDFRGVKFLGSKPSADQFGVGCTR